MKQLYLKHLKYSFLLLLVYTMYSLIVVTQVKVDYTEMIIGILFPYIPVWLSSLYAKRVDDNFVGTPLNIFALSIPLIVLLIESYLIYSRSLTSDGTGVGLVSAFAFGLLTFFVLAGVNLMLSIFVKTRTDEYKKDF